MLWEIRNKRRSTFLDLVELEFFFDFVKSEIFVRCFVVGVGSQSCFFKCSEFGFGIRVVIVLIDFALI